MWQRRIFIDRLVSLQHVKISWRLKHRALIYLCCLVLGLHSSEDDKDIDLLRIDYDHKYSIGLSSVVAM